jgi:zinc/manganese transport system permease protein
MLAHEFMRNAFLAGTFAAAACGLIGYFVVLRSQVFAGDALSHVAFTGALAAAAAGIDVRLGLFAATIAVAGGMGLLGERARVDDVVIGSVFAWVLGLGALFLSIFISGSSGSDGTAAVRVLFGSILGLSGGEARLAAAIAVLACLALLAIARPLLFASLDFEVARGLGLPVRSLGIGFFLILAVVAAEATQAVGALLLLGLLAAPGGAARLLTDRPWRGMAIAVAIAVGSMWAGLTLSYSIPSLPASTAVTAVAAAALLAAAALDRLRGLRREAPQSGAQAGLGRGIDHLGSRA